MKFYAHPDYSYSYAIVNHTCGEVYTYFANSPRIALKNALKRFDRILREAKNEGFDVCIELYNCNTATPLAVGVYEVPPFVKQWGFKSEVELMATMNAILDEYQAEADADPSWRERL
jgi:hypothetical protein